MRVGAWEATLIELAHYPLPPGTDLLGPAEWEGAPVELALNVLLLRSPGRVVLGDPGTGVLDGWFPHLGALADVGAELERAGTAREPVEVVISTHLDPDHAGGLVAGTWPDDLRPAFPNARVVAFEPELRRYRERDR